MGKKTLHESTDKGFETSAVETHREETFIQIITVKFRSA